jgi:hypothetical protein
MRYTYAEQRNRRKQREDKFIYWLTVAAWGALIGATVLAAAKQYFFTKV